MGDVLTVVFVVVALVVFGACAFAPFILSGRMAQQEERAEREQGDKP